jgi:hypothetical protein
LMALFAIFFSWIRIAGRERRLVPPSMWRLFLSHTQIPKNLTQHTPFSWPTILMKTRGDKPYEGLPNHPIFIFNIKLKKNLKRVNI